VPAIVHPKTPSRLAGYEWGEREWKWRALLFPGTKGGKSSCIKKILMLRKHSQTAGIFPTGLLKMENFRDKQEIPHLVPGFAENVHFPHG
jgi:hypothetical protein